MDATPTLRSSCQKFVTLDTDPKSHPDSCLLVFSDEKMVGNWTLPTQTVDMDSGCKEKSPSR
jgi:hypothetical protein